MSTNELTALCDSESCLSRANKKSYMSSKGVEKEHAKRTDMVCPDCGSILFWIKGRAYDKKKRIIKAHPKRPSELKDYGMGIG